MERHLITKLSVQKIRDIALDSDIQLTEKDTKKEILDKLFGDFSLVYDPIRFTAILYLSIKDILNFSSTNKAYRELYGNEITWNMLLKRDFDMNGSFEKYRTTYLADFNGLRRAVVQQAMKGIDEHKKDEWEKIVNNVVIRKGTKYRVNSDGFYIEFSFIFDQHFPSMYAPFGHPVNCGNWIREMSNKINSHLVDYDISNSGTRHIFGGAEMYFNATK